jgi:hypothetical protein
MRQFSSSIPRFFLLPEQNQLILELVPPPFLTVNKGVQKNVNITFRKKKKLVMD